MILQIGGNVLSETEMIKAVLVLCVLPVGIFAASLLLFWISGKRKEGDSV